MALIEIILLFCCSSAALGRTSDRDFESALIGPEFCGNGQVAWCQNFTAAVECDAVRHCVQSVWLTEKSSQSGAGSCNNCGIELDKIRSSSDVQTSKKVLKELLAKACTSPTACEKSAQRIDTYFNELLDLLKSDTTSNRICSILGACATAAPKTTAIAVDKDDVVVRFENIVLHLPANFLDVGEPNKLLGSARCTWGPSYWCNNLTSSKECKSTSHCIHDVWVKQHFDKDNDSVCKICKDMVVQARDQLQSNETQEELREVLEASCKLIPIKDVRTECIKLADEFVTELTEMLVSEMNPTAICTIAGLCNSARIDALLQLAGESESAGTTAIQVPDTCTRCTAAVTAVERYLQRAPRRNILDKLFRLCDQLSTFSDICASQVISHYEGIHGWLLQEVHPFPVCHMSGMCVEQYHRHSPIDKDADLQSRADAMLAAANDDLPCDLCKQLIKHLKDVLTTNTTEDEFHAILVGICKHSKSFEDKCLDIVNNDFVKIYKFLTEELDPTEVCRETNLCPNTNAITDENMNLISHPVSPPGADDYKQLALWSPDPASVAAVPVKNVECRLCKLVIQTVQKEMDKPEYEHNIEKVLKKVCSLVPRKDEDSCDQFIQEYANVLIKMLSDQTDPGIVCGLLDLCFQTSKTAVAARGQELCPICQYVLHFVQEELEKPDEQQKVEDVVRRVCKLVPKSQQTECQSFVTDYSALIITVLSEELDPSLVCPVLKLCPSLWSPRDRCAQCQHLMAGLVTTLRGDFSQPNVKNALSKAFVPAVRSNFTSTALELKVNHAEDIVDMVEAEFDAQESCVFLHFCDAVTIAATKEAVANDESGEADDVSVPGPVPAATVLAKPSCELCELVLQVYEDKFTSNATEKEIEDELLKWCDKIKNPEFHSNCTSFVHEYVPEMVKLMKKDVTPEKVCGLVKLCPIRAATELTAESSSQRQRCELCEAVVGSLESVAADPLVSRQTIAQLLDVCRVFRKPNERAECMKIVSLVGPQLEGFMLEIPSWYFCSKLRMCPYGARQTYKKVCDDSAQWCADVQKAVLCDKLTHCRQNVWKSDEPSPAPIKFAPRG